MSRKKTIILTVLLMTGFYCMAETNTGTPPPLLEDETGIPGSGQPAVPTPVSGNAVLPVSPSVPLQPLPAGPVPPPLPGAASPGRNMLMENVDISPAKIRQVLSTVKEMRQYLNPGKIWVIKGPGGELEIRGGIMYQGKVVSVVEFSPLDGSVFPEEYRPAVYQEAITLDTIRAQLGKVVNNMEILAGTWFSQPEGCWIIPVAYEGKVVTNIKIYNDGLHVVPDYNASIEMAYYGF